MKRKEALVKETSAKREELARLDGEVEKWIAGESNVRKIFEAREKKMEAEEGKAR
jgi:THO complex subunit 5